MERKTLFKKNYSFWSVSRLSYVYKLIFGKCNLAKSSSVNLIKNPFGFTLIELVTVIGVISILSVIGITALNPLAQFQKSTDARKKSDLSQIQKALETYYEDYSRYPQNATGTYLILSNDGETTINWGDSWQPYMNILPKPPDSTTYVYYVDEAQNGQSYYLYANLSRGGKDPQACNTDGSACQSAQSLGLSNACQDVCNYGVSSSNVNP